MATKILVFLSGYISDYVTTLYYTEISLGISNNVWSKLIYKQVNLTDQGSISECKIRCFFEPESRCKVLAFEAPICYLGDPEMNDTISVVDKTVQLFANYGKTFLCVTLILCFSSTDSVK